MVFSTRDTRSFARGGTEHGQSHENHQAGAPLSAAVCCLLRGEPGPLQSRRGLLFRLYPGTRRSSYPHKQGGPHGPGETHACNGCEPPPDHASVRSHTSYPSHVPACRHQCGPWFGPRIFLLPEKMANTEGETRSQTTEEGQEGAIQGATTGPPSNMEQVSSFLRGPL